MNYQEKKKFLLELILPYLEHRSSTPNDPYPLMNVGIAFYLLGDITEADLAKISQEFKYLELRLENFPVISTLQEKRLFFSFTNPEVIKTEIKKLTKKLIGESPIRQIIFIDKEKGIFTEKNNKKAYKIKEISKRKKLLYLLKEGTKSSIYLQKVLKQDAQIISKAVVGINTLCVQNISLGNDLIKRYDTGGYDLNREIFDIKFTEDL